MFRAEHLGRTSGDKLTSVVVREPVEPVTDGEDVISLKEKRRRREGLWGM